MNPSASLKSKIQKIETLRHKLLTNQSGRKINGRFLSQPPVNMLDSTNFSLSGIGKIDKESDSPRFVMNSFARTAVNSSMSMSKSRPTTTVFNQTGNKTQKNNFSVNLSIISSNDQNL